MVDNFILGNNALAVSSLGGGQEGDSSELDCFLEDNAVIATIKEDFDIVLRDLLVEQVLLNKEKFNENKDFLEDFEDDLICIKCTIRSASEISRKFVDGGVNLSGTMYGYFYGDYNVDDGRTVSVDINDIIIDNKKDVKYRVVDLMDARHLNNTVIYKKFLLRRI